MLRLLEKTRHGVNAFRRLVLHYPAFWGGDFKFVSSIAVGDFQGGVKDAFEGIRAKGFCERPAGSNAPLFEE